MHAYDRVYCLRHTNDLLELVPDGISVIPYVLEDAS